MFSFNVQRPFNEVLSLFYTKSPLSIKRLIGCFLRGSLHYQTTLLSKTGNTQLQQQIEIFCSSSFLDKDLNPNNKKAFYLALCLDIFLIYIIFLNWLYHPIPNKFVPLFNMIFCFPSSSQHMIFLYFLIILYNVLPDSVSDWTANVFNHEYKIKTKRM